MRRPIASATRRASIRLRRRRAQHDRFLCRPTATARSSSSFMAATGRRWTVRFFSHLAAGLNAHGIGVAIPSYDLCPDVTVDQIIEQMRMACARTGTAAAAARHQRPFRRRASCGLHARDRLAGVRRVVAAGSRALRPTRFRACSILARWSRPRSTRRCISTPPPARPRARCSGRRPRAAASMRWSARTKARNISGKAAPSSSSGARPASPTRFGAVPGANHFTAIAPLADPDFADGVAPAGTGGALGCKKELDGPDLGTCAKLL